MKIGNKLNIEDILKIDYYCKGNVLVSDGSIPILSGSFTHDLNNTNNALKGFMNYNGRMTKLNGAYLGYKDINVISMASVLQGPFGPIGGEFYVFIKKNEGNSDNLCGDYSGYKTCVDLKLFSGREGVKVTKIIKYVDSQRDKGLAKQLSLRVNLK